MLIPPTQPAKKSVIYPTTKLLSRRFVCDDTLPQHMKLAHSGNTVRKYKIRHPLSCVLMDVVAIARGWCYLTSLFILFFCSSHKISEHKIINSQRSNVALSFPDINKQQQCKKEA